MIADERIAGRFRMNREVARGGMGVVYEAIDEHTGERVAVKRMLGDDADGVRFAREAELLAEIAHPGLVRYVALRLDPADKYMHRVEEAVSFNETEHGAIRTKPLPEQLDHLATFVLDARERE